jgi:hypothetical protein
VLMCMSIKTMMKNEKFVKGLSRPRSFRVYQFAGAQDEIYVQAGLAAGLATRKRSALRGSGKIYLHTPKTAQGGETACVRPGLLSGFTVSHKISNALDSYNGLRLLRRQIARGCRDAESQRIPSVQPIS